MITLYFAEDGSYGDATNLLLLDEDATAHFTGEMWDRITEAGENERKQIAEHLAYNECVTTADTPECSVCGLTENQVN